jgi:hypothetical protein
MKLKKFTKYEVFHDSSSDVANGEVAHVSIRWPSASALPQEASPSPAPQGSRRPKRPRLTSLPLPGLREPPADQGSQPPQAGETTGSRPPEGQGV